MQTKVALYSKGLLFLFFMVWLQSHGQQKCDISILRTGKGQMYDYIVSMSSEDAIRLADSIIPIIDYKQSTKCQDFLWIKYYLGEAYELQAEYEKGLREFHYILNQIPSNQWRTLKVETYLSLARLHESIKRPEDCLRYLNQALSIIRVLESDYLLSRYAVRKSSYQRFFQNRDSAMYYANLAIQSGEKGNNQRSVLDGHLLKGILEKEPDSAVYHFEIASQLYLNNSNFFGAMTQILNSAKERYKSKEFDLMLPHLNQGIKLKDSLPQMYPIEFLILAKFYEFKSRYFESQNQPDSSLHYLKLSLDNMKLSDTQLNQKAINENEIDQAIQSEKVKREFLARRTRLLLGGILGLIILSGVLGFFLLNNIRQRKMIAKQNALIQDQNEELNLSFEKQSTLLSEIHHRVKNNLQLIISIITLQSSKIKDESLKIEIDNISEKIRSIALIHQQLYQTTEFEKIEVGHYFQNLINHYHSLKTEDEGLTHTLVCSDIFLNLETIIPLGMIITELINNSFKYAKSVDDTLHLDVILIQKDDSYQFTYKDSGPGYQNTEPEGQSSIGTILIRSMVRQLKGEQHFFNENGAGFRMIFKEKTTSSV